jgi:hypothetical protein
MEDVFHVSIPFLLAAVNNNEEAAIVRHELLVSLGDMIEDKKLIEHHVENEEKIISESALLALSYIDNKLKFKEEKALEEK